MNPVNFLEGMWTDVNYFIPDQLETYDDFYNFIVRIFGWGDQVSGVCVCVCRFDL